MIARLQILPMFSSNERIFRRFWFLIRLTIGYSQYELVIKDASFFVLQVVWVTAVLCPRIVAANNLTSSITSRRPRDHFFRGHVSAG